MKHTSGPLTLLITAILAVLGITASATVQAQLEVEAPITRQDADHEDEEQALCDSTCLGWKIGFIFLIMFEVLVISLVVRYGQKLIGHRAEKWKKAVVFFEAFAGGILFGVGLLELLAEAIDELFEVTETQFRGYPYTTTMFAIGFFLILGIESMLGPFLMTTMMKREIKRSSTKQLEDANLDGENADVESGIAASHEQDHVHGHGHDHDHDHDHEHNNQGHFCVSEVLAKINDDKALAEGHQPEISSDPDHSVDTTEKSDVEAELIAERKLAEQQHDEMRLRIKYIIGAALTTIALSTHTFFEGIALGTGDLDQAILVFVGVASHIWADISAICIQLVRAQVGVISYFGFVLFFSLAMPLGIGIGIAVSETVNEIATGTLNAIAAGCIIYASTIGAVGVSRLLSDRESWKKRWGLFGMYVSGFGTIAVIIVILVYTGVREGGHGH